MKKEESSSIETLREESTLIRIKRSSKISKEMEVFYNPIMKANRDISVLVLKALGKKKMNIGLPLEGSGIRGIRFLKELNKGQIGAISFNDYSEKSVDSIGKNLSLNGIKVPNKKINNDKKPNKKISETTKNNIHIHCEDANLFLLNSRGFDYIDIDPFGTSNPFLDSAVKRIARNGILAVTNTDTASLAGTYPNVCKRLYWATPNHGFLMHEIGLRILIRKIQLVGAQHDKALTPIFSYFKDHYFRIFFECVKSKDRCDEIISQHGRFEDAGPMWLGQLWDSSLVDKMNLLVGSKEWAQIDEKIDKKITNDKNATKKTNKKIEEKTMKRLIPKNITIIDNKKELQKFLQTIQEESKIPVVGFFDTHQMAESAIIKKDILIEKLNKAGFHASSTHFLGTAIRSDASKEIIKKLIRI